MTEPTPFTGQPQESRHSGTTYLHEPNPAKRAALLALFAQIKARLTLEQTTVSDANGVTDSDGKSN